MKHNASQEILRMELHENIHRSCFEDFL